VSTKNSNNIEDFRKRLGLCIRSLRESLGLSQGEFCDKYGLKTPANLSSIENGKSLVTLDALVRICNGCGISADSLIYQTERSERETAIRRVVAKYAHFLDTEEKKLVGDLDELTRRKNENDAEVQALKSGLLHTDPLRASIIMNSTAAISWLISSTETELNRFSTLIAELKTDTEAILPIQHKS